MTKWLLWAGWFVTTMALSLYLGLPLFNTTPDATVDKSMFLVGAATDGHHQIELACENCHTSAFGGAQLLQDACEKCHLPELKAVRDAHPKSKFTDPSNADRVAILDARYCVTCHREHKPDITSGMGLTVPGDVCFLCHRDIGQDRETHKDLPFDSCASSGCHNFHDNRALFEDFLVANASQPDISANPLVAPLTRVEKTFPDYRSGESSVREKLPDHDLEPAIPAFLHNPQAIAGWAGSAHATAGIDCAGCHKGSSGSWSRSVTLEQCAGCHDGQAEGFLLGRHGMRLAAGMTAMTPGMARIPMKEEAHNLELSCTSCHSDHGFNRQLAAVTACQGCHNSTHVQAYDASPHARLGELAFRGEAPEESAVTCATCHMPRETGFVAGHEVTHVQHNQNANLRPSDKMLRSVCMNCHALSFSIDALADPALVASNFSGRPSVHVKSIDMAVQRREAKLGRYDTDR